MSLKTISQEELKERIYKHQLWLRDQDCGERLVLIGYDLYGSDLSDSNLSYSNLSYSNLSYSNLYRSNLYRSNLSYSDLYRSNLYRSDLSYSDLSYSDLSYSNLSYSDLSYSDLSECKLPYFLICPEEGDFVGYKKLQDNVIIKVLIKGKRTSSLVGRKCRTDHLQVLEVVENPNGVEFNKDKPLFGTHYRGDSGYYVGAELFEPEYDDDIRVECAKGLHFFMTLREAQEWG